MTQNRRQAERGGAEKSIAWDYGDSYTAVFSLEAIAASTPYILVDLSDTVNFPHNDTESIILTGIRVHAERQGSGVYDVWFGVISELDATNGTAEWFHRVDLETGSAVFAQAIPFNGFNLKIDASGNRVYFVTNQRQAGHTNWQNDVYLTTPAGTAIPAVGDLVMWVEEISGTGTIDLTVSVDYDTQ